MFTTRSVAALERRDGIDGKDEPERRIACAGRGRRLIQPPNGFTEKQRQLSATAKKPLLLDVTDHRGVTDEARRGQWVRRQHEMVESCSRDSSGPMVLESPALDIHAQHGAVEVEIDTEPAIQRPQLFGDPPDSISDEAIVAVEDGTGIHQW